MNRKMSKKTHQTEFDLKKIKVHRTVEGTIFEIVAAVLLVVLWVLTIAAIILGVRRSDDRRPASEPSMFPALDAYRVNLRKERA